MNPKHPFKWCRFQADIILLCVRWYLRYPLSYRNLEEIMLERGLTVDHTTVYRWVQAYAPELDKRCRAYLEPTNDSWGGAFEPERGEQFEIGIKQEFFDDRLSANLTFYPNPLLSLSLNEICNT